MGNYHINNKEKWITINVFLFGFKSHLIDDARVQALHGGVI